MAREAATTYEAAIDRLLDKLERQVERYRDKRTTEVRRRAQQQEPPVTPEDPDRAAEGRRAPRKARSRRQGSPSRRRDPGPL